MAMFAGLDVGGKKTAVCVVDEAGKVVWRGMIDTHPEMIAAALQRFRGKLARVGLESGSFTPHLHRALAVQDFPMVCMDARRTADATRPANQDRQERCAGARRDAAHGLVHGRARQNQFIGWSLLSGKNPA